MLPDIDGFEVCRRLRDENICTPVLFLTARDATADKLAGLAHGDDYVTKPFSIDELVARIRAVLRRTAVDDVSDDGRLRLRPTWWSTSSTHEVWRAEQPIDLTATEFNLLLYFLSATPARCCPRPRSSTPCGTTASRRLQHRGDLHLLPAQEDRLLRPPADPHHPAGGVQPPRAASVRLRRRLVVTMIVLVAVGLAAVDLITFTSLHSYLYGRVDDQLPAASQQMAWFVARAEQHGFHVTPADHRLAGRAPTSTWSSSTRPGTVVVARPSEHPGPGRSGPEAARPCLAVTSVPGPATAHAPTEAYRPLNRRRSTWARPAGHGPEYRLEATSLPG